jgi:hypothetical protein
MYLDGMNITEPYLQTLVNYEPWEARRLEARPSGTVSYGTFFQNILHMS